MKNKIIKIAKALKQGTITESEAQNLLLSLFGVSGSLIPHMIKRCKKCKDITPHKYVCLNCGNDR